MRGRVEEIRRAGAELVMVGNGSPTHARVFAKRHLPGCTVLTDPSLELFKRMGMRRGVRETLGPSTWKAALRSTLAGHIQGPVEGDPWQQGGLVALGAGGLVVYSQRNQTAADRPDVDAALAALCEWRRLARPA